MNIIGIHHVGLVSSDADRSSEHFERLLGLRLLARDDDRLFLGAEAAAPGLLLSIQLRPRAEPGRAGVGGTHHFAMMVETRGGLLQWKRWLTDQGVAVDGPLDRHYFESISHRDPDGHAIEIATRGAGWTRDDVSDRVGTEHRTRTEAMPTADAERDRLSAETWAEPIESITPEMQLQAMHHVTAISDDIERTHAFMHDGLGLTRVEQTSTFDIPGSRHWYWGVGAGDPGTVVTYVERRGAEPGKPGPGQVDHYALGVPDRPGLQAARERLLEAGYPATEITSGRYFDSFRTQDPDGQPVEIATRGPGFASGGVA